MDIDVESIQNSVVSVLDELFGKFTELENKIGNIKIPKDFSEPGKIKKIMQLTQLAHDNVRSARQSLATFVENLKEAEAANIRLGRRFNIRGSSFIGW